MTFTPNPLAFGTVLVGGWIAAASSKFGGGRLVVVAARVAARVAMRAVKRERRYGALGLQLRGAASAVSSVQPVELLELKEAFDRLPPRQRATAVLAAVRGSE